MAEGGAPQSVLELRRLVATPMGMDAEELTDSEICRLLGIKRGTFSTWAANKDGEIPPTARPKIRRALVKLRAEKQQEDEALEDAKDSAREPHSYVARGFYFTGAEFLQLDPEIQRQVLAIVEKGKLRDVGEPNGRK